VTGRTIPKRRREDIKKQCPMNNERVNQSQLRRLPPMALHPCGGVAMGKSRVDRCRVWRRSATGRPPAKFMEGKEGGPYKRSPVPRFRGKVLIETAKAITKDGREEKKKTPPERRKKAENPRGRGGVRSEVLESDIRKSPRAINFYELRR